jgi:hypothetical protein
MSSRRPAAAALAIAAALLLANALPARAGARLWSFLVLDVAQVGDGAHVIRLKPAPPGKAFPQSCSNLVVHARFDLEEWSAEGRQGLTRQSHDRSVQLLLQAQATEGIVRLGALGLGFSAESEESACEVVSRGLQIELDPTGAPVIFSVYEEPGSGGADATIR